MAGVRPIPAGMHTVTPHLIVKGASDAIAFYTKAFGAQEVSRMPGPDGRLMHAEIKIGDSSIYLAEEAPHWGALGPQGGKSPVTLHLFVEDADAVFNQAAAAGATVAMPVSLQFWGDKYGKLIDPYGHHWAVATRIEDLTPAQMAERGAAFFSKAN